ncbi:MAG: phosphomannomutase/phosphoglucomutase [Planctomycetota bacterium]|jgi:phosphomannomutase
MAVEWTKLQNGSDIRGVALEGVEGEAVNLTPEVVAVLGAAYARWLTERTGKDASQLTIGLGHDSRLSADALKAAFFRGVAFAGATPVDCALASTPAMFMSTIFDAYRYDGAVMVTASHLPFNRNGLKFFTAEGGAEKADIKAILELAASLEGEAIPALPAPVKTADLISDYAAHLVTLIREGIGSQENFEQPLKGQKIVVDAGNGAGGFYVSKVLQALGADTTGSQFLDPDGRFPNHIPNPEEPEAIEAITKAVLDNGSDFGIIFDTDVDRAGAVDRNGKPINRNRFIALMAAIILEEFPGSTIVTDSITSEGLASFITETLGGKHHRFKRGYKNVINESIRLNETGEASHLAIETSGHGAVKENYFLDDGAYQITRILIKLAQLAAEGKGIETLVEALPEPAESKEFRVKIGVDDFQACGNETIGALAQAVTGIEGWEPLAENYEGIRVRCQNENEKGWFLLRLSLHDPVLPLNIESDVPGGVQVIRERLLELLQGNEALDLSALQ